MRRCLDFGAHREVTDSRNFKPFNIFEQYRCFRDNNASSGHRVYQTKYRRNHDATIDRNPTSLFYSVSQRLLSFHPHNRKAASNILFKRQTETHLSARDAHSVAIANMR